MKRLSHVALMSIPMALALAPVVALADVPNVLKGTWIASRVVQDGKPAAALVGHRLTFERERFRIDAQDGKRLFTGTARVDPAAKPSTIDFLHGDGDVKGKTWKGIYAVSGDTLTVADNAPDLASPRPKTLEAKSGSGHVLFVFTKAPN